MTELILRLQQRARSRNNEVICRECGTIAKPLREVSILNIVGYVLVGFVLMKVVGSKWCFFVPFVLAVINAYIAKPKCRKCRSFKVEEPTSTDYENWNKEEPTEEIEEIVYVDCDSDCCKCEDKNSCEFFTEG